MRLMGDWMVGADDRILEFLREEGPSTPTKMYEDGRVRFSRPYINVRCQELAKYGLVNNLGNGVYVITEEGEQYLDEELDTATIEPDENNMSPSEAALSA